MSISNWLMVVAVLVAPFVAVHVQKFLERSREKRYRKLGLFQALMATRAARVSLEHVRALNMIDIEFYEVSKTLGIQRKSERDKAVRDAWGIYRDHLNTPCDRTDDQQLRSWSEKGDTLFVELLHVISHALDYDFDKVLLKRSAYWPEAHSFAEMYQQFIKGNLVDMLRGKKPLHVKVVE